MDIQIGTKMLVKKILETENELIKNGVINKGILNL